MATDTSWFSIPPIDAVNLASPGYVYSSQYVTMSDNCKIAVDTYLPPDYFGDKKQKYPTILHFTRYNRCWKVKWPFSLLLGERYNVRTSGFIERFVTAPASPDYSDPTYVWVTVDVRGTGASYGTRYVDFSEREVEDFQVFIF